MFPNEKINEISLTHQINAFLLSTGKKSLNSIESGLVITKMNELKMITRRTQTGKFTLRKPKQ